MDLKLQSETCVSYSLTGSSNEKFCLFVDGYKIYGISLFDRHVIIGPLSRRLADYASLIRPTDL
jgi:hypothetical protein